MAAEHRVNLSGGTFMALLVIALAMIGCCNALEDIARDVSASRQREASDGE